MSKAIAEQSQALSIFWLNKQGYLKKPCEYQAGIITWTYGSRENKSSVSFSLHKNSLSTPEETAYIGLIYTHTSLATGEKNHMDFKIQLDTTHCNYGGQRYWFICPLIKGGQYCGRRVGVIYLIGKYFGCRHCGEIAYQSQMYGGRYKGFASIPDVDKAKDKVKRVYYNGKPTRKFKRYIALSRKFETGFMEATMRLNKKYR
ncbi:MAG: hypothetical protein ABIJ81_00635 [Patescibacteria group bacterium]